MLRRERAATFASVHRTRSGHTIPMQTNARLADYEGRLCVVALCRDDTERRQFQRELSRANLSLERAVSERTRQLEGFAEDLKILHAITTTEHASTQDRYSAYLKAGCEMFDLPIGVLAAVSEDPQSGQRAYSQTAVVAPDPEHLEGLGRALEVVGDRVRERDGSVSYADATDAARGFPASIGGSLRAIIGTPVRVDRTVVGTLTFASHEPRPDGFAPYEIELVEVMADAIARHVKVDRAETAEAEAHEWYQSIVETVDEGVIVVDADCRVLLSNPAAQASLGLSEDGTTRWPLVDVDGRAVLAEDLPERQVLRTGQPTRGIVQGVLRPDGTTRWYRVNASPIARSQNGSGEQVVVSFSDVTEYRDATHRSTVFRGLLRSVLDASPDGIMAFRSVRDAEGAIADFVWLLVNPRAEALVDRQARDLIGARLLEVFPGNREAGLFDAYVTVVETGARFETVIQYPHDGFETSFRVTATPISSEDGFTVTFAEIIDVDPEPSQASPGEGAQSREPS